MAWPINLIALVEAVVTASAVSPPRPCYKNAKFQDANKLIIERAANVGGGTVWGANLNGLAGYANKPGDQQTFVGDGSTLIFDLPTDVYNALANNNIIVRVSKSGRTGTATVTAGSNAVAGAGTAFATELNIGDEITINGELRTITGITSATALTVDVAFVGAAAGASVFLMDSPLVPTTDYTVSNPSGTITRITVGLAAKVPLGAKIEIHKVTPVAMFTFATATLQFKQLDMARGFDLMWYAADATVTPSATNVYIDSGA